MVEKEGKRKSYKEKGRAKLAEKEIIKVLKYKGRGRDEIRIGRNKEFNEEDRHGQKKDEKKERSKGRYSRSQDFIFCDML
jgi:hypothetical protein